MRLPVQVVRGSEVLFIGATGSALVVIQGITVIGEQPVESTPRQAYNNEAQAVNSEVAK
jgi:hypothetical protein